MSMFESKPKVVVVGAGSVGCLAAIELSNQGWAVEIYEGRPDIRLHNACAAAQQRSINLSISARGIYALESVLGTTETAAMLSDSIPMRGRMIHDEHGVQTSQTYDRHGRQTINSMDRAKMNALLLSRAAATPGVRVLFEHMVESIDYDRLTMVVRDVRGAHDIDVDFVLCVGADGCHSTVRRQLMRVLRMDYQQAYIPHVYVELRIPSGTDQHGRPRFLLDPHHLHMWPRHAFLLIASPNADCSFTMTLFAPHETFNALDVAGREGRRAWFVQHFPDVWALVDRDALLDSLKHNPRGPLMYLKTSPYHYREAAVLVGDAAHAMVPFYGQGLNCGLEDVRVLSTLLRRGRVPNSLCDAHARGATLENALAEYSATRYEDACAITDLAREHYDVLRHNCMTLRFRIRRAIHHALEVVLAPRRTPDAWSSNVPSNGANADAFVAHPPAEWRSLYEMVTFSPWLRYSDARARAQQQERIVHAIERGLGLAMAGAAAWGACRVQDAMLRYFRSEALSACT